jgi:large conductance mechanosensitive channel
MGMLKEFREFAMKGNVVDLAVGVVIGGAFGKIVSSLVADVITPFLGLLIGGVNFSSLKVILGVPIEGIPPATINYGVFLQSIFDFLIIAFALFMVIKIINTLKRNEAAAPVPPTTEVVLLTEIRDLLKK